MNENDLVKTIGYNIKKYRLLYNKNNTKMTKKKLAQLTNLSISHISSLENQSLNKNISIKNLYKISKVLEVPISKFFEIDDDK